MHSALRSFKEPKNKDELLTIGCMQDGITDSSLHSSSTIKLVRSVLLFCPLKTSELDDQLLGDASEANEAPVQSGQVNTKLFNYGLHTLNDFRKLGEMPASLTEATIKNLM